jgi:hypothetical protein
MVWNMAFVCCYGAPPEQNYASIFEAGATSRRLFLCGETVLVLNVDPCDA